MRGNIRFRYFTACTGSVVVLASLLSVILSLIWLVTPHELYLQKIETTLLPISVTATTVPVQLEATGVGRAHHSGIHDGRVDIFLGYQFG